MAAAGVDMIGASQFLGWPSGPSGTPTGQPAMSPSSGSLYQPQVTGWGNCPEMSMIDWVDGSGHAQFWTMKMLIDGLGNADKHIYSTAVVDDEAGAANGSTPSCAVTKQLSAQQCVLGRTFGCLGNGSMWTEGGCSGVFSCLGEGVLCGPAAGSADAGGVGARATCACLPTSGYYQRVKAVGLEAAKGTRFAGGAARAVVMASFSTNQSSTVNVPGATGAAVWSVAHAEGGWGSVPYKKAATHDGAVTLPPLGVALVLLGGG